MISGLQQEIERELELILTALGGFPLGASAEELKASMSSHLHIRTLQRRLETLHARGYITQYGSRRTTKYFLNQAHIAQEDPNGRKIQEVDSEINLSSAGKDILAALKTPYNKRTAVVYNRKFVDGYRPNIDFYLSEIERGQLMKQGATPDGKDQPAGTYAKQILQRLLIDLSWNSSRLEGNTYSLLDTERLLSQGERAANKSLSETQMILNHKEAIEFMVAGGGEIDFNRYTIQNLHALLSNDLLPDPAAPGRIRTFEVRIGRSAFTPTAIPQLIEEMFDLILDKASRIENPYEQALFIMIQLPYLQPFEDVNKRVSRLAANISLNKQNLVPISFIGVSNELYIQGLLAVYELNRTELLKDIFLWACARSADRYGMVRQTLGEPDPFRIKYRATLQSLVAEIVSQGTSISAAGALISTRSLVLPENDQKRFIEMVETELLSLHDGNFARYRVSPKEFATWKKLWGR